MRVQGDIAEFYDVEDTKIGEGSFGRVCGCANRSTGAERAVKMLRKVRRRSQLIMFRNELSTLKMCTGRKGRRWRSRLRRALL